MTCCALTRRVFLESLEAAEQRPELLDQCCSFDPDISLYVFMWWLKGYEQGTMFGLGKGFLDGAQRATDHINAGLSRKQRRSLAASERRNRKRKAVAA